MTGKTITDMTFFKEYYKLVDHEIYTNWKEIRLALTPEEKKQRDEKKQAVIEDFEKQYGYRPSEADIHWLVDDFMPKRYTASIEKYRDDENNPEYDRIIGLSVPTVDPLGEDLPDDLLCLQEIAETLTDEFADIYEFLLVKYAGGTEKLSMKEIADKWGISLAQAYKDKDKIIQMIRDKIGTLPCLGDITTAS